jgi:DNA (cytosine-5)-methyltransferase 1
MSHPISTADLFAHATAEIFTGTPVSAEDLIDLDFAVDLFAGPGGWDEGARMLGERTGNPDLAKGILGFEFEPNATATARAAGHARVHGDLSKVNPAFFKAPGLIASPPCQGFSPAGKGRGREDFVLLDHAIAHVRSGYFTIEEAIEWLEVRIADSKSALIMEPLRWVLRMAEQPRWLAFEQVKTCLPIWELMATLLRDLGYSVWTGLVYSEEYGVPQTRTRAVLLGSLDKDVSGGPTKSHGRYFARQDRGAQRVAAIGAGLKPWVTLGEALGWQDDTFTHMGDVYNSKGCIRRGDAPAPTMTASMDNGNFRTFHAGNLPEDEVSLRMRVRKSDGPVTEVEGDTSWVYDRPSVTVVGSFRPDVAAAPGYRKPGDPPRQKTPGSVRLSQVEQGVLQSFPADYPWQGSESVKFQQAGNAVPPLMAAGALETVAGG